MRTGAAKGMRVERVALAALLMDPRNARRHDERSLRAIMDSLARFGQQKPVVLGRLPGTDGQPAVVAGNGTIAAARRLGWSHVLAVRTDLTPAEARAYGLADNRTADLSGFDVEVLAEHLEALRADDVSVAGLGFDDGELERIVARDLDALTVWPGESTAGDGGAGGTGAVPGDAEEDEAPPVADGESASRQGEVYVLGVGPGAHRLVCGDCRQPEAWAALAGERVNVAFTSPPYASQRKYDEASGFRPIPPDEYSGWWEAVQGQVREHLAPDGSFFVNIKEHCEDGQRHLYVKRLVIRMVDGWEWRFVDELCWLRKPFPGSLSGRFKNGWESVYHFSRVAGHRHYPDAVAVPSDTYRNWIVRSRGNGSGLGSFVWDGTELARPSNVLNITTGETDGAKQHPATFPVGLPGFFILAYSDQGDVIADPFIGSGTTLIAAAQRERRCYGIEISPYYCDVVRRRWTRWALAHGQDPGPGALEG